MEKTIETTSFLRITQSYNRALVLKLDDKHKHVKIIEQLLPIERMINTHNSIRFAIQSINKSGLKAVKMLKDLVD